MAGRIRSIKPELLEDDKAAALSDIAWRLWVSTWCIADDHGRFRCSPAFLHGQAFWGSPRSVVEVEEAVQELDDAHLITVYTVNGQLYALVTNWTKHQRVDNAGKPRCPGPDAGVVRRESRKVSANLGELPPDLRPPISTSDLDPDLPRENPAANDFSLAEGTKPGGKSRKLPALPIPDDWKPTDEHYALALKQGVPLETAAQEFRNHALANDRRQARWSHAFTNWLLKAPRYGGGARASPKPRYHEVTGKEEYPDGDIDL